MRTYCLIVKGGRESAKKSCERRGLDMTCVKVQETLGELSRVHVKEESPMDARVGQTRLRLQRWHQEAGDLVYFHSID